MNSQNKIARRPFIQATLAVGLSTVFGGLTFLTLPSSARGLNQLGLEVRGGKDVWMTFRKSLPEGALSQFVKTAQAKMSQAGWTREKLAGEAHEDYAAGRVVSVAGWVLSLTEVQFLAVLYEV